MAKRGEGRSRFLKPFDKEKAKKLQNILRPLMKTVYDVEGVVNQIDHILQRPSYVRKCDIALMGEIFEAIDRV